MRTKPPTSRRSSSPHIDSLNVQKSSSSQDCPLKTLPTTTKERKIMKSTNSDETSNAVWFAETNQSPKIILISKWFHQYSKIIFLPCLGNYISRSNFWQLRPRNIKPANKNLLRQCQCEYCENVGLNIQTIKKIAALYCNNAEWDIPTMPWTWSPVAGMIKECGNM